MAIADVIQQIDAEIAKLEEAKTLLSGGSAVAPVKGKRGRPKGSGVKTISVKASKKTKRTMSPEARARIAAAQKARWAKAKKGA